MILSDLSVKRPVFASVLTCILVLFGYVSFERLSLREYPDIDPPVVSVEVSYPGASADIVESKITELVEERIAGIEGIKFIESGSEDGESNVSIEFEISRDIDGAANDVRDRVSTILDDLPDEADPPEIQKVDSNDDVIVWLNLQSDRMSVPELTDYAERYLVDRFSVLDGVARIRVGGGQDYAMRVWLDRNALAARNLSVADVEAALRAENVELPAGSIESKQRQFTVRLDRSFRTPEDFRSLVLSRGANGYLVRLGDVARVEKGTVEDRTLFRGNGEPMVGIGTIKQSTANTITVARGVKEERNRVNPTLPDGTDLKQSYDTSIFVEEAISEVYWTLGIAVLLVVLVIYCFLGDVRAMFVPAVTVPVSLISTFIILYILNFSINLLTLLGLVLAIGLVVDDAIVVLENISRRIRDYGETRLVAAYNGAREVGFAVVATTFVLVAVFVPLAFLQGDIGRLFSEFALTMAAAVFFSSFVALTLCPMLASKLLSKKNDSQAKSSKLQEQFERLQSSYERLLQRVLKVPSLSILAVAVIGIISYGLFSFLPSEYAPKEDRGAFFLLVNGPEGASYEYMKGYMDEIEDRMKPYIESGEMSRLLVRAPRSFGNIASFNSGIVICLLSEWSERRDAFTIMDEVREKLSDLSGVQAFPVMRQGFGGRIQKPVQFVIGGGTYEQLVEWRDLLLEEINRENPGLVGIDYDYKETKPQVRVQIDYDRAAELGVKVGTIGRTLETMLGSKRVTTYIEEGEEYDVIIEGERSEQSTPLDLQNLYVRSERTEQLIPLGNLVELSEFADSPKLNRYNRIRAITLEANLSDSLSLGEALRYLEDLVKEKLPETAIVDYKGQSRDFKYSGSSIGFVFILGLVVTFLVLAAQFESYIHPFIIMLTVPTAAFGALSLLFVSGGTLNIYSQIGLVMLVGLAAKNGILIVEFANQLRDRGVEFDSAIMQAATARLRPILMTGITTAAGSLPLIIASGAGAETRQTIGIVILGGVTFATFFTVFLVPAAYSLFARGTESPEAVAHQLEREREDAAAQSR
ncbi:efflux RND transporter permease subunit [bacterium]|nr:efflux RND transporter permease subunit [bacterium]